MYVGGFIAGTLFYQLEPENWSDRVCLCFFSAMFVSMGAVSTIPVVFEQRRIFYKHRDAGFYPTSAAVVAQMLVQAPVQAIEAFIFTSLTYFLSGLSTADNGWYYFIFFLICYLTSLTIGQYFRLIVYCVYGLPHAQPLSAVSILLMVVFSGLTVNRADIPSYWTWLYWANPLSWSLRALVINEFTSPTPEYQETITVKGAQTPLGKLLLQELGFESDRVWIQHGILYLVSLWVVLLLLTTAAMHFVRWTDRTAIHVKVESKTVSPIQTKKKEQEQEEEEGGEIVAMVTDGSSRPALPLGRGFSYTLLEDISHGVASMEFLPVTLAFRDVWYSVDVKQTRRQSKRVDLLRGVSGYVKPGEVMATYIHLTLVSWFG